MSNFDKYDQQVMDLVNKAHGNQPVGYLINEAQAREFAELREESSKKEERIHALTAHNEQLVGQIQEEQERKAFRRKVLLPAAAGSACAIYLIGSMTGMMDPTFAAVLGVPIALAGMLPFAPWQRRETA